MAFNDPEVERLASPKRKWLAEHEAEYEKAKAWVAKYGQGDTEYLLKQLISLAQTYRPTEPSRAAVYILAQQRQLIADSRFQTNIIRDYEAKLDQLRKDAAEDLDRTGKPPTPDG